MLMSVLEKTGEEWGCKISVKLTQIGPKLQDGSVLFATRNVLYTETNITLS